MKAVIIQAPTHKIKCAIDLPASKSMANRALILQAINPQISISNLSLADDTLLMQAALQNDEKTCTINVKNAGTCMRFLTAYFASQQGREITLLCDERMKQRPIKTLVDALIKLGAEIYYIEKNGYPPLLIKGKKLTSKKISIDASQSSQFVSALMLIAPQIIGGLDIELSGNISSLNYIEMTTKMMTEVGYEITKIGSKNFHISHSTSLQKNNSLNYKITIESDWSSAAYWYQIAALSQNAEIILNNLGLDSKQGDKKIEFLMKDFVKTRPNNLQINISHKAKTENKKPYTANLQHQPDLSPSLAVILTALGVEAKITGLQNLIIKESNRLQALHHELNKLGYKTVALNNEFSNFPILKYSNHQISKHTNQAVKTYNDHRIAMAFAPLALLFGKITIENPDVVQKSYPHYWNDLIKAGFIVDFIDI